MYIPGRVLKQIGREEDDSGNEYGLQVDAEKHLYIESHVDYTAQPKISMPQHACRAEGNETWTPVQHRLYRSKRASGDLGGDGSRRLAGAGAIILRQKSISDIGRWLC